MKKLLRPCPVCGGERGDVLHHQQFAVTDDYPLPDAYDVVICATCGMVYADTPATQADYDRFYATCSIYEQPAGAAAGATPPEDLARLEQIGALYAGHIPSRQARILEVGCANGGLLQVLGRLGFSNLVGVDPSPACVENTRRCGCESYRGDLAHLPAEIGRFDAVILTAVLEHVLDVKSAVSALASVCADDGRIFLEVPDAAGYADYLYAPFQDINTEHINHFSLAALQNLMGQFGFTPVLEQRMLVPGPSRLMFPGLEVGYERRSGHVRQPWVIDPAFRGQMERYIHDSRVMMEGIDRADPESAGDFQRGDSLGDRAADHEAAVRHGAEGRQDGCIRGWKPGERGKDIARRAHRASRAVGEPERADYSCDLAAHPRHPRPDRFAWIDKSGGYAAQGLNCGPAQGRTHGLYLETGFAQVNIWPN